MDYTLFDFHHDTYMQRSHELGEQTVLSNDTHGLAKEGPAGKILHKALLRGRGS
jgi:hypothetical protein